MYTIENMSKSRPHPYRRPLNKSPVNETLEYECYHENKGTDQVWSFRYEVCKIAMSPGDETQDYECRHENKGTDHVWYFNDDVCGFEAQIATKSVHNTITCTPSPIQKTPQLCCQVMKLRIMNVDMKIEVLIKFGTSTMMCVDLRPK